MVSFEFQRHNWDLQVNKLQLGLYRSQSKKPSSRKLYIQLKKKPKPAISWEWEMMFLLEVLNVTGQCLTVLLWSHDRPSNPINYSQYRHNINWNPLREKRGERKEHSCYLMGSLDLVFPDFSKAKSSLVRFFVSHPPRITSFSLFLSLLFFPLLPRTCSLSPGVRSAFVGPLVVLFSQIAWGRWGLSFSSQLTSHLSITSSSAAEGLPADETGVGMEKRMGGGGGGGEASAAVDYRCGSGRGRYKRTYKTISSHISIAGRFCTWAAFMNRIQIFTDSNGPLSSFCEEKKKGKGH